MSIATLPRTIPFPLSPGATTETDVGTSYSVALAGIPFILDRTVESPFTWGYLPTRKEQQDASDEPGEQSLSTGYWRRARSSWHEGAGQEFLDAPDSSQFRFFSSKGVDVWTKNKLALLPATESKRASANTNLKLMLAGSYLYMADGTSVVFTSDPTPSSPSFTSASGLTGTINDIASDGTRTYVAANGNVYRADIGSAAHSSWSTITSVDRIGIANGFFLAGAGRSLYVVDTAGTDTDKTPGLVTLSSGATWSWVGFASGPAGPYAAGKGGEKGWIFQGVIDNTGALSHFVLAAELPDGETVESIASYLGQFLVIGTSRGLRLGLLDADGAITYSALVDTGQACQALEPEDRFVYFGWPSYDASTSGLGRADLSTFSAPTRPAYASDLMADNTGAVTGIITHGSRRYFVVSGRGLYGQTANKVASGNLRTGKLRWNTLEPKHMKKVFVRFEPLEGSFELETAIDGGSFASSGTYGAQNGLESSFLVEKSGQFFELNLELTRDSSDTTLGPTVTGWVALGIPSVQQQRYMEMFVMNFDVEETLDNEQVGFPGRALQRWLALLNLKEAQEPITFQGPDYGVWYFDQPYVVSREVTIEDLALIQSTAGGSDGFGGRVRLLLHEVK